MHWNCCYLKKSPTDFLSDRSCCQENREDEILREVCYNDYDDDDDDDGISINNTGDWYSFVILTIYIQSLRLYNSVVLIYFYIIITQVAFQYLLMRWNCCYLKRHFIQGLHRTNKKAGGEENKE